MLSEQLCRSCERASENAFLFCSELVHTSRLLPRATATSRELLSKPGVALGAIDRE
jgi:hypothetical protein